MAQYTTTASMNPLLPTAAHRLRNSCDACNTAKVKCSKEHPRCRRCERKELFCVYSVSLRCSKKPVDGRSTAVKNNAASAAASAPRPAVSQASHAHSLAAHLPPLDTPMEGSLDGLDSKLMPTSLYDFDALSDVNFDLPSLDDYFTHDPYLPPAHFAAYAPTAASTPPTQPSSLPPSLSRSGTPLCGCQQHILSKLSELSLSSPALHGAIPFDRALSENRAIVALCTSALDCTTCARSDDVMLILTLSALLAHVLGVFENLFRARREALQPRDHGPSPPESVNGAGPAPPPDASFLFGTALDLLTPPASVHGSGSSSSSSRPGTTASSGLSTPRHDFASPGGGGATPVRLCLGSYELDERDESILQTSLLKIELGKITALVEAFEARLGQTKLHHDLVAYLKQGLSANYEALKRLAGVCGSSIRGLGRTSGMEMIP